jgi:hypothetical protein
MGARYKKGSPDEIGVGAPYKRTLAAPDGSPSAASSAASPGYNYTLGPPPSARTTPPSDANQRAGRQALARRTTFVRPDFFMLTSPPRRSRTIPAKLPCRFCGDGVRECVLAGGPPSEGPRVTWQSHLAPARQVTPERKHHTCTLLRAVTSHMATWRAAAVGRTKPCQDVPGRDTATGPPGSAHAPRRRACGRRFGIYGPWGGRLSGSFPLALGAADE